MLKKTKQVTKKPVTKKPVTKKPVTKKPVTKKPVTKKPGKLYGGKINITQMFSRLYEKYKKYIKPTPKELKPTELNDAISTVSKVSNDARRRVKVTALKGLPTKLNDAISTVSKVSNDARHRVKVTALKPLPTELNDAISTVSNDARHKVKVTALKPLPTELISLPIPKESKATPRLNGFCSRILMPKQVGGICWFTTAFVAMFYSQRSRKILQKASKNLKWDDANSNSPAVFVIKFFEEILNDKYMKKDMNDAEYKKLIDDTFKDETFGDILENLHTLDGTLFPFNTSNHRGYASYFYMANLYYLLKVDYMVFHYNSMNDSLYGSILNNSLFKIDDTPKILIVTVGDRVSNDRINYLEGPIISDDDTKGQITSMNDEILYRGRKYHLDSVIVRNFNETEGVHSIVGITCKKNKYVYNGLERKSRVPAMKNLHCGLMPHDWKIKGNEESGDRCINIHHDKRVCFNFSKGFRTLVYVLAENGFCSRILMPKQVGGICWFTALFVAMFYSQRSRKILQEASKKWKWDVQNKSAVVVFDFFKKILDDKYMKKNMNDAEYKKLIDDTFKDETFGDILKNLHELNKTSFLFNPSIHLGYSNASYISRLYNLLNVNYKVFDYNIRDKHLFYSFLNIELFKTLHYELRGDNYKNTYTSSHFKYNDNDIDIPEILMVYLREDNDSDFFKERYPNTIIGEGATRNNITSMNDEILYRGRKYHLDSVIVINFNETECAHAIVGITCKQERYVYNGWPRKSKDPTMKDLPCGLMLHDWKIKGDEELGDRCININNCTMDPNLEHHKLCFNFSKGFRTLVYVLAENISVTSNSLSRSPAIKKISL